MSQHSVLTRYRDRPVVVVSGYDRPLNDLFLQVLGQENDPDATEESILYSSLEEPRHDWTDINTVASKLAELDIQVPDRLLEAVYLDQLFHAGNRMARHHLTQPPEVLRAE